jgi:hypothetical protein
VLKASVGAVAVTCLNTHFMTFVNNEQFMYCTIVAAWRSSQAVMQ